MAARYEVLQRAQERLRLAGIVDAKTDSWLLYEKVTRESRSEYLLQSREELPENLEKSYMKLIERRCCHVPVQHMTGEQAFMGLSFLVNEHVLVPRMDTEVLVLTAEKYMSEGQRVLDMCTGSGCVAISLKKRNPALQVSAVDISDAALQMARKNAVRLETEVSFYTSDLFACFRKEAFETNENIRSDEKTVFDKVISNPPYIPTRVIEELDEEVREHEPRLALDGLEDGLEFYRRIARESTDYLSDDGMLFFEIGYDQAEAVSAIMEREGFCDIQVVKDLAGLDRVIYGGMKHV